MNLKLLRGKLFTQFFGTPVIPVFFVVFFIVVIADGILAYIFPIVVEQSVGSNTMMGLILALSSIAGLICDFVFPSLISRKHWKQLLIICVSIAFFFPLFTYYGQVFKYAGFFVIASIIWGICYEFLAFSQQNYIVHADKERNFSKDWGLLALFLSIVAVITPVLGSELLNLGGITYAFFVLSLLSLALMILLTSAPVKNNHKTSSVKSTGKEVMRLIEEFKVWGVLSRSIWQVLTVSLVLQSLFASYWVFGGLFGQELAGEAGFDWIVMFLFAVPGLIAYLMLSRLMIKNRKKALSHMALIIGGFLLMIIVFTEGHIFLTGMIIFLSSLMFAISYPLNNAVFSDLATRLGKEQNHLFGMVNATGSIAFIVVPILLGLISDIWGYYNSFAFMGGVTFFTGIVLVFTTPRKIHLPQKKLGEITHTESTENGIL